MNEINNKSRLSCHWRELQTVCHHMEDDQDAVRVKSASFLKMLHMICPAEGRNAGNREREEDRIFSVSMVRYFLWPCSMDLEDASTGMSWKSKKKNIPCVMSLAVLFLRQEPSLYPGLGRNFM